MSAIMLVLAAIAAGEVIYRNAIRAHVRRAIGWEGNTVPCPTCEGTGKRRSAGA